MMNDDGVSRDQSRDDVRLQSHMSFNSDVNNRFASNNISGFDGEDDSMYKVEDQNDMSGEMLDDIEARQEHAAKNDSEIALNV